MLGKKQVEVQWELVGGIGVWGMSAVRRSGVRVSDPIDGGGGGVREKEDTDGGTLLCAFLCFFFSL